MSTTAELTTERLAYRRQFLLSPGPVSAHPGWLRLSVRGRHHLAVHPDLNALQMVDGARSLTLLGYVLDPNHPAAGDREIVGRLLGRLLAGGWPALLDGTADLGGRWILIGDDGERVRLAHDPCGYRQVVFVRRSEGVWCASQPGLLAGLLGVGIDPEAEDYLHRFPSFVVNWPGAQHWWPGDATGYREIRHLLPNHTLDLEDGTASRFWPARDLPALSLGDAVDQGVHLLRGIFESAARRAELTMALTAGRDSRLLLAASRPLAGRMQYITFQTPDTPPSHPDLVVTRRLAARFGLDHRVLPCPAVMEPWFAEAYARNVPASHDVYGVIAQALWHAYPQERLFLKGNASSVMHNFDRIRDRYPHGRPVPLEGLLRFSKVAGHPFGAAAVARWWEQAGDLRNADVIQLFYWETKEGKWMASAQLEWDIIHDVLAPFNCRTFLSNALAVHHRFRSGPTHLFQRRLTAALWPDVLREPINAVTWDGGPARRAVRDFLVRCGWHRRARRLRDALLRKGAGRRSLRSSLEEPT